MAREVADAPTLNGERANAWGRLSNCVAANLPAILAALREREGLRGLANDLDRRAASCCELKAHAADVLDAYRLMGKEAAYLHAAELARAALSALRSRPTREDVARAIDPGFRYDDLRTNRDPTLATADRVLRLFEGGE
jgi:hypothetical protein